MLRVFEAARHETRFFAKRATRHLKQSGSHDKVCGVFFPWYKAGFWRKRWSIFQFLKTSVKRANWVGTNLRMSLRSTSFASAGRASCSRCTALRTWAICSHINKKKGKRRALCWPWEYSPNLCSDSVVVGRNGFGDTESSTSARVCGLSSQEPRSCQHEVAQKDGNRYSSACGPGAAVGSSPNGMPCSWSPSSFSAPSQRRPPCLPQLFSPPLRTKLCGAYRLGGTKLAHQYSGEKETRPVRARQVCLKRKQDSWSNQLPAKVSRTRPSW